MTEFDENGESKNEFPKIAHFLLKSQHKLGEYSAEDIMIHDIPNYAKQLQIKYQDSLDLKDFEV